MKILIKSIESLQDAYILWEKCGIRLDAIDSPREFGYKSYFEKKQDMFVGAYVEEKLIGSAICFFDGRKSSVYRMAVDPKYRNKAVASAIISHIEKLSQTKGANSIYAMVEKTNLNSQKLFNKLGYDAYDNLIYFTKNI